MLLRDHCRCQDPPRSREPSPVLATAGRMDFMDMDTRLATPALKLKSRVIFPLLTRDPDARGFTIGLSITVEPLD